MAKGSAALRKADTSPAAAEFAAMLDESLGESRGGFEGSVARGTVVNIVGDFAVVDVGLKSEGRIPLKEFAQAGMPSELKIGDNVNSTPAILDGRIYIGAFNGKLYCLDLQEPPPLPSPSPTPARGRRR